jgi:flagellar hook-basal body complex protein FliE
MASKKVEQIEKLDGTSNPNWKPQKDSSIVKTIQVEEKVLAKSKEEPESQQIRSTDFEEAFQQKIVKISNKQTVRSEMGQIVYKVPDTMQVGKNYDVIVRISKSKTNVEITQNIQGRVITKKIKTTNKMQVELKDPTEKNFTINKINSSNQLVDSTYTEWRFLVTPIKSGHNQLVLVVSIFKDNDVKQLVYSDEIWVKSNAKVQITNFWEKNWQWSFDKILIPLVVWLFGMWLGRRSKKN